MRWAVTLVLTVATALLAAPAGAAAVSEPLTPPTALAPGPGATTGAGMPVTFSVRGEPDDLLVIRVSRSDAPAEACGTIGADVATIIPEATSQDPAVYAATPQVFSLFEFWLNRPGTYWWQVYRIHYGDGADGCVEAPPQSLTVTGVRPVEIGPDPLAPAEGEVLPGGPITFTVRAEPDDQPDYLWVSVSRSPLVDATGVIGFDAQLVALARTADPARWTASPAYQPSPAFWMNSAGTYWWQPHRISYFGDPDGKVEGPVRSFAITAAPASPTSSQTIRGDRAFTEGTANDLYLACTSLDLYLVDVLPAANGRVGVSGAADLRLAGRTVEILRDGRRVGSTVVGSAGGFSARVPAPPRARRALARYRARVGTTLSQNLKLERRMVAIDLRAGGSAVTLTGRVSKPFARRPAVVGIQRYRSCRRKDTVVVRTVRPDRQGRFSVRIPVPPGTERALMYRATTRVATRAGGPATQRTYTLPRAIAR